MRTLGKTALIFTAIGLVLYLALYIMAEWLLYRTGDTNPFFKMATATETSYDWVILGASHAMPLDFAEFNDVMERETNQKIINLATPGTGPLYNRFVLEQFLQNRRAAKVLYVLDSFAFYSRAWNEARFSDAKLLRRTLFQPALAWRLLDYCLTEGVDPRAELDYVTGFSKINNPERFKHDIWEGEVQFERVHRPSAAATAKRIAYLYPEAALDPDAFTRYLREFEALIDFSQLNGVAVVVIKMPVPARFHSLLPNEAAFDEAMSRLLAEKRVPFHDFSLAMDEPRFYFDTDHLNRVGLTEFFARQLKSILTSPMGE
jgi:hypothetical protein